MGVTAEAYARQLAQLLPGGPLLKLEAGSWLTKLLLAIGEELARLDARSETLVDELDPRTSVELLGDWERVLGLPDPGLTIPAATADRQVMAARKYAALGGQTKAFFVDLASRAGFVVGVVEAGPYTWRVGADLAASTVAYTLLETDFRAGDRAGSYVTLRSVPELEVVIRRSAPAHTLVRFVYP